MQKKWEANADKVAFAKSFPGRLFSWEEAAGKTIERVARVEGRPAGMIVFSDHTFILIPTPDVEPADLIQAILTARPFLEARYKEAYEGLDQRILLDRELTRQARLENIMGAIRNNLPRIPELKERLRLFLEEGDESQCEPGPPAQDQVQDKSGPRVNDE